MTDRAGEGYLVRHQDYARALFEARSGEPLHEVSPELILALILENDRPETWWLQHTLPWSTGLVTIAANAGFNGKMQVNNPTGSGLLVVVQGMKQISKAAGGQVHITLNGALGTTPTPNISLDSRAKIVAAQPVVASENRISNTTGINGVRIDEFTVAAGGDGESTVLQRRPVILTPGHSCEIWDGTVSEQGLFFGWGYERPILPTELVQR